LQGSHWQTVPGIGRRLLLVPSSRNTRPCGVSLIACLAATALVLLPGGASACGCGEMKGVVVAHGSSLYGVPWRIKASRRLGNTDGDRLLVHFSIGEKGSDVGYLLDMPLPIPRELVFAADGGSAIDEYPENDLSGFTTSRAVELRAKMNDGTVLTIKPVLPPVPLRQRFPWLKGTRFFDIFFASTEKPLLVTALDRDGQVLGRSRSDHGSFHALSS
jgi:hypothetical protein